SLSVAHHRRARPAAHHRRGHGRGDGAQPEGRAGADRGAEISAEAAGGVGPSGMARTTVIFDFGGVLIDWDPRHLYRKLFAGDDAAMEEFLATVCNSAWNVRQDGGRPIAEATRELTLAHPHH